MASLPSSPHFPDQPVASNVIGLPGAVSYCGSAFIAGEEEEEGHAYVHAYIRGIEEALAHEYKHGYIREIEGALMRAVSEGVIAKINVILTRFPFCINTFMIDVHSEENTILFIASGIGNIYVVETLLAHGADVHKANKDGFTPLFTAVFRGHVSVVVLLLDHGADVNSLSSLSCSPLFIAASVGHIDVLKELLGRGANVNLNSNLGICPLYKAVCTNQFPVVKFLLDHGADVNHVSNGSSSLLEASNSGNLSIVEILLEFGADVDMEFQNYSPRLLSHVKGHIDVTRRLAEVEYARSNARDQNVDYFKDSLKAGVLPAPFRQWISLLLPAAREELSTWVNSIIADEVSCYAAFFLGTSTMSLRRLTNHQSLLSHYLIELLVRRSPAKRRLFREVLICLRVGVRAL